MGNDKVILTREGYDKLHKELALLKGEKRQEIIRAISEARAQGDLSENAEYDAAKESQAMNEKRIAEIEYVLSRADILDDSRIPKDTALIGATIKMKDLRSKEEFDYMLVSEAEADYDNNKISLSSPVGKALIGHKIGDIIEIKVPAGVLRYEIIGITR
ncbi:transcription elongation factor GreA [Candidatus Omnitrophus magneticus]|uniref:Transcription elongation factor GreA n=1 Tax=Candidatus Omnitrophus magneticus TaxID=1609969 RepID=A0A0F0CX01_9BACT|nr:transcription elongation factor GreA [Candidatus Omnitrophus magneticus]